MSNERPSEKENASTDPARDAEERSGENKLPVTLPAKSAHNGDEMVETLRRFLDETKGLSRDRELCNATLNLLEDTIHAREAERQAAMERERVQKELLASNERLRALFDSMTEAFVIKEAIFDAEGRVVDYKFIECNPAFKHHTGLGDPVGHTVLELMPDIERFWLVNYENVLRTGEAVQFEAHIGPLDRWLAVSATRFGGQESRRIAIVFSDVTASRRAREAVRESEERLKLIIENAREYAIFTTDLQRRVTSWNSGAERLLGWSESEIIGKSADVIFTPEDRENHAPESEAVQAIKEGRATDERWHVRKDGSQFWGSGVMNAMRDANDTCIGLVKIFRDQTNEREARERLEKSQADLWEALQENEKARAAAEAAITAKDHFLALLSHELRTPLTPVLMALEMLKRRDEISATVRETLGMIERNIALEARFIDDMLDVTRIERGKLEMQLEAMDLHEAVVHAAEVTRPDVDKKKQILALDLRAADHLLQGDAFRLQQVFWNLLKNASKFTPENGFIRVESRNSKDRIIVTISDNGVGFPPNLAQKIFDPFQQADATVTRLFGGLGLGLAIAKAAVNGHGGKLSAHSDGPGTGATFSVELPLAGSPPDPSPPENRFPRSHDTQTR